MDRSDIDVLLAAAEKLRADAAGVPAPPWSEGGIGDYGWTVHMGAPDDAVPALFLWPVN